MTGKARPASGLFSEPREVTALGDLFANIWQLCWLTSDFERGMGYLRSGGADRSADRRGHLPEGRPAGRVGHRIAMGSRGGPIIELIEPGRRRGRLLPDTDFLSGLIERSA